MWFRGDGKGWPPWVAGLRRVVAEGYSGLSALPFPGVDCFARERHNGVCLWHWLGLHLETDA